MLNFTFGGQEPWTYEKLQRQRQLAQAYMLRQSPRTAPEGIVALVEGLVNRAGNRRGDREESRMRDEFEAVRDRLFGSMEAPMAYGASMPAMPPAPMPATAAPEPAATQLQPPPPVGQTPLPPADLPPQIGAAVDRVAPPVMAAGAGQMTAPGGPGADTLLPPEIAAAVDRVAPPASPPAAAPSPGPAPVVGVAQAGRGWTEVILADGTRERRSGNRSDRNYNPGNIEFGNFAREAGAVGTDGRFAVFPTPDAGFAAMERLLQTRPYAGLTISGAIHRWAPPSDGNDSAGYAGQVASALGVPVNTPLSALSPEQRAQMVRAMARVEGYTGEMGTSAPGAPAFSGGGGSPMMMGQGEAGFGMDLRALAEVMGSPFATAGDRALASALLSQQMAANDPMRQMQLQMMQMEMMRAMQPQAGATTYGLSPQYGVDAQGNPVLLQLGNDGTAAATQLPPGVTISPDPLRIDAGTHWILLDPVTRQPIGEIPKNNEEAAFETAQGRVLGEATANRIVDAPGALATADATLAQVDRLLGHPGLDSIIGNLQGRAPTGLPWFTGGQRGEDAATIYNNLESRLFLQAFESLRGAGAITQIEGQTATQAMATLSRRQSEEQFRESMQILREFLQTARDRVAQGVRVPDPYTGSFGGGDTTAPPAAPPATALMSGPPQAFLSHPEVIAASRLHNVPIEQMWANLPDEVKATWN